MKQTVRFRRRLPAYAGLWLLLVIVLLAGCDGSSAPESKASGRDAGLPGVAQDWPLPATRVKRLDDGAEVALRQGQGQGQGQGKGVTLINFWATWCGPCLAEIPDIEALYQAHRADDGLRIVGVALDSGSAKAIRDFAAGHDMHYRIVYSASQALDSHYGLIGLPITLVVDGHGIVRRRLIGPHTTAQFNAVIEAVRSAAGQAGQSADG